MPKEQPRQPSSPGRASAPWLEGDRASVVQVAGTVDPAKQRRSSVWTRTASLLLASAVVLALDLAFAVRPWITLGLTALETLFLPVWLVAVIQTERRLVARLAASRAARPKPRLTPILLALGLVLACLAEKWLLIYDASEGVNEAVVVLYRTYTVLAFVLATGGLLGRRPLERFLVTAAEHPARLMVLSFGVAALLGSFLLTLPQSLQRVEDASFVDGLFTAMSAVCVTGLAVNSVPQTYTPLGQGVLLLLIQVGGLGIMVLSTFFAILAGQTLRLRDAAVMAEMIDAESLARLRRSVASIVVSTFVIEGAGALLLFLCFRPYEGIAAPALQDQPLSGSGTHLWAAVFHSVSAFCNAGFSLFQAGLVPTVDSASISAIIMALVVLGGLGFPVIDEVVGWAWARVRRIRPLRLSLHSRVVLLTTAVLIVAGAIGFLALEWGQSMQGLSAPTRVLSAFFQSVMPRTAGFNTLDFSVMRPATWMFVCVLMFIGAAPASTAGGIKVTTVAVLFASLRAELKGYEAPRFLGRAFPAGTVQRAVGVASLSVVLVACLSFVLLLVEPHQPIKLVFETVSAFATVGLSTGITPELSVPGKLVITLAMFIGRIGPLTLALALANQAQARSYRLPEERVGIG